MKKIIVIIFGFFTIILFVLHTPSGVFLLLIFLTSCGNFKKYMLQLNCRRNVMEKAKKFNNFKGADAYGKAESSKDENGPVIVYLADETNADELTFLSLYFNGDRQKDQDQINSYYEEVSKAISASNRYQKQLQKADKFEIK